MKNIDRNKHSAFHVLLAAVITATLTVPPAHAGPEDEMEAPEAAAGARTDVTKVADGGTRGEAAGIVRGPAQREAPGAVAAVQAAANSIAERTGLTNPELTTARTAGGVTIYSDKKTGQDVMAVKVDGAGGGTVTLLQNTASLETTIGTRANGVEKTTTVDMSKGSMTFNITATSAKENLAASMTASGDVIVANAPALAKLSPGGTGSLDNVSRVANFATTNFNMTAGINPTAPAGNQSIVTYRPVMAGAPVAAVDARDVRGFAPPAGPTVIPVNFSLDRMGSAAGGPAAASRVAAPAAVPSIAAPAQVSIPRTPSTVVAPTVNTTIPQAQIPTVPAANAAPALQPAAIAVTRPPAVPVTVDQPPSSAREF